MIIICLLTIITVSILYISITLWNAINRQRSIMRVFVRNPSGQFEEMKLLTHIKKEVVLI